MSDFSISRIRAVLLVFENMCNLVCKSVYRSIVACLFLKLNRCDGIKFCSVVIFFILVYSRIILSSTFDSVGSRGISP